MGLLKNLDNMITAEEFLQEHPVISHYYDDEFNWEVVPTLQVQQAMIEFAKLYVEAALKAASENAQVTDWGYAVSKDSILNAYPLENIK